VKPELAEAHGKRLLIAAELEEGTRLNTSIVKQLCSTDAIEAEKQYKDPFHFTPSHTLVLYTNHLPKAGANDPGTWRRLLVIPFNALIQGKCDIKNYVDWLYENFGEAILAWIIHGAEKIIAEDFCLAEPECVTQAIAKYREDNDWLGHFIAERCEAGKNFRERSGDLYAAYRGCCSNTGVFTRSTADFYSALEFAGFCKHKERTGSYVVGLKLKDEDFLSVGMDFLGIST
jgi:P4 family phage/plasmid primase-like protien